MKKEEGFAKENLSDPEKEIRERLILMRRKLKLTQIQFAKDMEMTACNVSHAERYGKKMPFATIYKCVFKYNVSADWIITGKGSMFFNEAAEEAAEQKGVHYELFENILNEKFNLEKKNLILENELFNVKKSLSKYEQI